jgi:hypothetical protein
VWEGVIDAQGRAIDLPVLVPSSTTDPRTGRTISEPRLRFVKADATADTVGYPSCPGQQAPARSSLHFVRGDGRGNRYMSVPFLPQQQMALTSQGTVWCTPSDQFRLFTGPVGGTLREVVTRTLPPIPVTAAERKENVDRIDSLARNYGRLVEGSASDIPQTKPQIERIFADNIGRVWTRRTGTPQATPSFDVFDASGRHVATVASTGPIGYQTFITNDAVLTVLTDEDGVPYIVRYRIRRA